MTKSVKSKALKIVLKNLPSRQKKQNNDETVILMLDNCSFVVVQIDSSKDFKKLQNNRCHHKRLAFCCMSTLDIALLRQCQFTSYQGHQSFIAEFSARGGEP